MKKTKAIQIYGDYHTHTRYSDGSDTIEDNIIAARQRGLKEVAITDHGRASYMSLTTKKLERQRSEIIECRKKYPDIRIFHGVEANLHNWRGDLDLKERDTEVLELVVAGYHTFAWIGLANYFNMHVRLFFQEVLGASSSAVRRNTATLIKMLEKNKGKIHVLAHIGNLFSVDVKEVAKACADLDIYIEINQKHFNPKVLDDLFASDAKLIACTDAHKKERVGNISAISAKLEQYDLDRILNTNPDFRIFG